MKLKTALTAAAMACALMVLPGCGDSPEKLLDRFQTALMDGDEEAAVACVLEEDANQVRMLVKFTSKLSDEDKEKAREKYEEEMEKTTFEVEGDTAYAVVDGKREKIAVKQDGEWKLDF